MNSSGKRLFIFVTVLFLLLKPAQAAFVLFDNFNSYTPASQLIGQGPVGNTWALTIGSPTGMVVTSRSGEIVTAAGPTAPSAANRSLVPPALSILNSSSAATVFWQFTLGSTVNNNWNFVITDTATPPDTAGSSEVQFNFDNSSGNFRARNAGGFKNLSLDGTAAGNVQVVAGTTYNVWFEINNSADNYRVYLQSDGVPGLATRTQVLANDGTGGLFGFRNGAAANDLITANFGSGNGQPVTTYFDNIYVDTAGFNSANPVPEPCTLLLALLGGAGIVALRRRVG